MASYLFPTEIKHENIMVESRSWEIEAGRKTTKNEWIGDTKWGSLSNINTLESNIVTHGTCI